MLDILGGEESGTRISIIGICPRFSSANLSGPEERITGCPEY
jgi:hypothetical protein